jgi:hypothetical protein
MVYSSSSNCILKLQVEQLEIIVAQMEFLQSPKLGYTENLQLFQYESEYKFPSRTFRSSWNTRRYGKYSSYSMRSGDTVEFTETSNPTILHFLQIRRYLELFSFQKTITHEDSDNSRHFPPKSHKNLLQWIWSPQVNQSRNSWWEFFRTPWTKWSWEIDHYRDFDRNY